MRRYESNVFVVGGSGAATAATIGAHDAVRDIGPVRLRAAARSATRLIIDPGAGRQLVRPSGKMWFMSTDPSDTVVVVTGNADGRSCSRC